MIRVQYEGNLLVKTGVETLYFAPILGSADRSQDVAWAFSRLNYYVIAESLLFKSFIKKICGELNDIILADQQFGQYVNGN